MDRGCRHIMPIAGEIDLRQQVVEQRRGRGREEIGLQKHSPGTLCLPKRQNHRQCQPSGQRHANAQRDQSPAPDTPAPQQIDDGERNQQHACPLDQHACHQQRQRQRLPIPACRQQSGQPGQHEQHHNGIVMPIGACLKQDERIPGEEDKRLPAPLGAQPLCQQPDERHTAKADTIVRSFWLMTAGKI